MVCIRNSSSWLCLGLFFFHGRLAVVSEVGKVTSTIFWTDRWLHGQCITDLAPRLFSLVPKRRAYKRTVQEALMNYCWVSVIKGALSVEVIVEYFDIRDVLGQVVLQTEVEDSHIWRLYLRQILRQVGL